MTKHRAETIAARRSYENRVEREPDQLHDYIPSRKPDDDDCSVCGRSWDAAIHVPIDPDEPEVQ